MIEYAAKLGLDESKILFYTDDGISGATSKRPDYQRMVTDIRSGAIERVIVFECSRISRDLLDYIEFLKICRDYNTKLDTVESGEVAFSSPKDVLMASMQAYAAQIERENTSKRTRSGLKKAREAGVKLGAHKGEQRKLGYRKTYDEGITKKVVSLRNRGLSYRAIAEALSDENKVMTHTMVKRILERDLQGDYNGTSRTSDQ